jgi:hypothetical protein
VEIVNAIKQNNMDLSKQAWILKWNYREHKNMKIKGYEQHDWNQTLITRINQVSAQIRKATLAGPSANSISINPKMLPLIKDLEYTKESNGVYTLSGRYKIILDEFIPKNEIYVFCDNFPIEPIILESCCDDDSKVVEHMVILSTSPKLKKIKNKANKENISLHIVEPYRLVGKIEVLNYNKEIWIEKIKKFFSFTLDYFKLCLK